MARTPGGSPATNTDLTRVVAVDPHRVSQVCYLCGPPPDPLPPVVRGRWELLLCWPHNAALLLLDMTPVQRAQRRAQWDLERARAAELREQYGLPPVEPGPHAGEDLWWVRCEATPTVRAALFAPRPPRVPLVA